MYVGHFAIGLGLHARFPQVKPAAIMIGIGFLDMVNGVFVATGIDRVSPSNITAGYLFFDLDYIDWDHSLVMALLWSLAYGLLFRRDRLAAIVAGCAAFSHFLADIIVHNGDMAFWPNSQMHLGVGLWHAMPIGSWLLEGLFAVCIIAYSVRQRDRGAGSMLGPSIVLLVLFVLLSPWLSPMIFVARLSPRAATVAYGALVTIGSLIPALIITALLNRSIGKSPTGAV